MLLKISVFMFVRGLKKSRMYKEKRLFGGLKQKTITVFLGTE